MANYNPGNHGFTGNGYGGYSSHSSVPNQPAQNSYTSKVNVKNLPAGITLAIRGTTGYFRLSSAIEGTELERANQKKAAKGNIPRDRPYCTFTLGNVEILPTSGERFNPDIAIRYFKDHIYLNRETGQPMYTVELSMSPNPENRVYPSYIEVNERGQTNNLPIRLNPGQELDNGLLVTVLLETVRSRNSQGSFLKIQKVIVHGKIRLYEPKESARPINQELLSILGLTIDESIPPAEVSQSAAPAAEDVQALYTSQQQDFGDPYMDACYDDGQSYSGFGGFDSSSADDGSFYSSGS